LEKNVTKEEIMTAIRESAEKIGHAPSLNELQRMVKLPLRSMRKNFGTYAQALRACGMERRGSGYQVSMEWLFEEWAGLVRRLGKMPTTLEWETQAKCSTRPLVSRFKTWAHVPQGLMEYARKAGREGEWEDVVKITAAHVEQRRGLGWTFMTPSGTPPRPRTLTNQPIYGTPLLPAALTYAPTNESGVIYLFGTVARDLGYAVTRIQTEFPDCEAMRRLDLEHWQRVRIEFEYESRNFLIHGHSVDDCDLIVCWNHNWPECPLEVLELRRVVGKDWVIG
jgi:hypothetical protein